MLFAKKKKEPEFDPSNYILEWAPGVNRKKSIRIALEECRQKKILLQKQADEIRARLRSKGYYV